MVKGKGSSGEGRHKIERENGREDRADNLRTEYGVRSMAGIPMWLDHTGPCTRLRNPSSFSSPALDFASHSINLLCISHNGEEGVKWEGLRRVLCLS